MENKVILKETPVSKLSSHRIEMEINKSLYYMEIRSDGILIRKDGWDNSSITIITLGINEVIIK